MEIIWYGHSCYRLTERSMATVVTDPFDADAVGYSALKLKADIVTVSHEASGHNNLNAVKGYGHAITGPGEFEIGGVFITGVQSDGTSSKKNTDKPKNTLYVFDYDGITVGVGIRLVKSGKADAFVSAGHSGAVMGASLLLLGMSKGVDRPAIATLMPNLRDKFLLLDVGANVDCSPENLHQFALMGNIYCRLILGREKPKVGLLGIGEEDIKGNELTKEAFKLIKESSLNFIGNIEGKDIFSCRADVVVCDGFTGNIALKISEGLAETIIKMLKREISSITAGRLGYLMLRPAFKNFKKKTDYDEFGGAPLLGINGTSIISHGRSSSKAIRNALRVAHDFSRKRVYEAISDAVQSDLKARVV